jgi:hypothetical protein
VSPVVVPGYGWNADSQRYIDTRTGRFVARERIRLALDQAVAKKTAEMKSLALELRAGHVSVNAWRARTRELVKDVNLYSAAAARGGWAQMTPRDYGRVGRAVRAQYGYLERFAREIANGLPLDGRFLVRVALYAKSGRTLYGEIVGQLMGTAGFDQERNRLGAADHCTGAGSCVEQTSRGWVARGSLIPIGQRLCLGNCECFIQYRRSRDGAIA